MDEKKAGEVCGLYEIPADKHKGFVGFAPKVTQSVGVELVRVAPKMKVYIDKDAAKLIQFTKFLEMTQFGADPEERSKCLRSTNKLFGIKLVTIDLKYADLKDAAPEMISRKLDWAPALQAFCKARPDKAVADTLEFRSIFAAKGKPKALAYEIVHYFHQHSIDFKGLKAARCVKLQRLSEVAPAHTPFQGFKAWGPGNAKDKTAATNLRGHFCKHVLDVWDEGPRITWKDELRRWWIELGIKLKRTDAEKALANRFNEVARFFGSDANDVLQSTDVVAFLAVLDGTKTPQAFVDFMCTGHLKAYENKALEVGRNLTQALVNGEKKDDWTLAVTGRAGDIYLYGRLDDANELGISSCYFAENMGALLNDRIPVWALH